MKTKIVTTLTTLFALATPVLHAESLLPKNYKEIRIERNLSDAIVQKSMNKIQAYGLKAVLDPKFDCKSLGYTDKDIIASGTMYGTNRKDGGIDISGVGDFKAYSYVRYAKDGKECREKNYTKEYDPSRYGKHSIAIIFP